jgi:hypothetical protein
VAVTSVVEKRLGALPVAAGFLRRLDVAGIVDEVCPGGASALVTHGQVIEALVANRLTSPAPLVRVEDWARKVMRRFRIAASGSGSENDR